ncbi:hypothetical protein NHX12_026309, partial [Muraenolepis orangiensis]
RTSSRGPLASGLVCLRTSSRAPGLWSSLPEKPPLGPLASGPVSKEDLLSGPWPLDR